MKQHTAGVGSAVRADRVSVPCSARRGTAASRVAAASLGIVGILIHSMVLAQAPAPSVPGRLTVRPHEMATGTQSAEAGEQTVDSLEDYLIYVPQQCVGTQRCPLVVVLHGGGGSAAEQLSRHQELADRDGMILLLGTSVLPGRWDIMDYFSRKQLQMDSTSKLLIRGMPDDEDVRNIDAAMKYVLRKYAIDPNKIALLGMSDGGSYTSFLGRNNLDVFSRLISMSPGIPFRGAGPQNTATQVFVLGGIAEQGFLMGALTAGAEMQQAGHKVSRALLLRGHEQRGQDYDLAFTWLKDSWASAGAAARSAPRAFTADSVTALTVEAVAQMTAFWTALMEEPDSILDAGRSTNQARIVVPVGGTQTLLPMFDIPALAVQYPSVAAKLKAAGLTAEQEERYAIAILSAIATRQAGKTAGSVPEGSMLAKNVELLDKQPDEFKALTETGMWVAQ